MTRLARKYKQASEYLIGDDMWSYAYLSIIGSLTDR